MNLVYGPPPKFQYVFTAPATIVPFSDFLLPLQAKLAAYIQRQLAIWPPATLFHMEMSFLPPTLFTIVLPSEKGKSPFTCSCTPPKTPSRHCGNRQGPCSRPSDLLHGSHCEVHPFNLSQIPTPPSSVLLSIRGKVCSFGLACLLCDHGL